VSDGRRVIISFHTNAEVLEGAVLLLLDETLHELVLVDHDMAVRHDRDVMAVAVDIDRLYSAVIEQSLDPHCDVAFLEVAADAFIELAQLRQAKNIKRVHGARLDDVVFQLPLFGLPLFPSTSAC